MTVQENVPLKYLNTFGIDAKARWFTDINSESALQELFSDTLWKSMPRLVLGGGSNVLFKDDFEGLVIHINIPGISYGIHADDIYVTAGAGEIWNDLVNFCVEHEFAGIENLSLIPGSVGASPVQNIGAYGAELQDVFHSCRAFDIVTGKMVILMKEDCRFTYRDSIFKSASRGRYIITEVTLKLSKIFNPRLDYGAIRQELADRDITKPSLKDISAVVSHIRVSKLPDPSTIGNAGSFFKNPVIPVAKFIQLQSNFPDIVHYSVHEGFVKLAAGWLIEQCGWKGVIDGNTGTWKNQALVIVNHGNATGNEIFNFSEKIIESVRSKFDILLQREVNIV